jgi:hypothetical protein
VNIVKRGLPAVAVVTASFADLASKMADHNEHPELPILVLPYPLEDKPEDEVREIGRRFFPEMLDLLGLKP